eukprot:4230636-Pleurochrysis_carterae.AAC.1
MRPNARAFAQLDPALPARACVSAGRHCSNLDTRRLGNRASTWPRVLDVNHASLRTYVAKNYYRFSVALVKLSAQVRAMPSHMRWYISLRACVRKLVQVRA